MREGSKVRSLLVLSFAVVYLFCVGRVGGQIVGQYAKEEMKRVLPPNTGRSVVMTEPFMPDLPMPIWDKGYLVSRRLMTKVAGTPNVWLYNAKGDLVREGAIWFPDSTRVILSHAAVTSDGRIVVSGFAEHGTSIQAFFIAWTNKSGTVTKAIRTNPYVPMQLCVAPDGTAWTAGGIRSDSQKDRNAANVLRHFDPTRGLIESYLSQSTLGSREPAGSAGPEREVYFACDARRVVFYSGVSNQYVELMIPNHEIRRWNIEKTIHDFSLEGLALTASGEVYPSLHSQGNPSVKEGLYHLQRDNSPMAVRWVREEVMSPTSNALKPFGYLHGADGDLLVHSVSQDGNRILYWSPTLR